MYFNNAGIRDGGRAGNGEESPDSTGQEVLLAKDAGKKFSGKESATENIPPERSGKVEMAV